MTVAGDDDINVAGSPEHPSFDPSTPNNAASFVLRFVGFDRDVLEVGAGAGALVELMEGRGNRLTVDSLDAGAEDESSFDVVLFDGVFDRLDDPVRTLRAARRVLRPGGSVVVAAPNAAHVDARLRAIGSGSSAVAGTRPEDPMGPVTRSALEEWLAEAGLRVVELERVFGPMLSRGPDEVSAPPPEIVAELLLEVEAETLEFVVRAKRIEDEPEATELERRVVDAEEMMLRAQRVAETADAEVRRIAIGAEKAHARAIELMAELDAVNADRQRLRDELDALRAATPMGGNVVRRAYKRLRDGWG